MNFDLSEEQRLLKESVDRTIKDAYQPVDEIGRDLIRSLRRGKRAADGTWTAAGTAD
jgi:hypothetical protein